MWNAVWVLLLITYPPVLSFSFAGVALQSNKAAIRRAARRVSVETAASSAEAGPPPAIGGDGPANDGSAAAELVTSLLGKIEGTNRGVDCTPEQQKEIDGIIDQLNTLGADKDWLNDSRVFGNYNVAYVSSGPSQRGNPAGGRWRGRVGRSLFRTEEMFQHLVEPTTAVNMVVFRAFGLLKGPVKARILGAAAACGAVAAGARLAFVPATALALVSLVLVATQGGIIRDEPDIASA